MSAAERLAAAVLALWLAAAALAPLVAPDPLAIDARARLRPPAAAHVLGTDQFGRDVAARLAAGAGYAVVIVALTTVVAGGVGTALGLVAGLSGGATDAVLSRVVDLWLALPELLFAIALAGALGPSFLNATLAIGVMRVPSFARVARSSALSARGAGYVEAARALGATGGRVLWRHALPNVAGPLVSLAAVRAGTALLAGSALSFVGLGAPVPAPEWGALVAGGRPYLAEAWWIALSPCVVLVLVAWSLQTLADWLAGRLDPRTRGGG